MSAAAAAPGQAEVSDVLQERLIDSEYKIWKKNTPYLYDVVMTHALEWPSLTCQWLPTVKKNIATPNVQEHSLLLGTHTTGEQNYLMVASCNLPKEDVVIDNREAGKENNANDTAPHQEFQEDRQEVGGFGHSTKSNNNNNVVQGATVGKIEIRMKICHSGEVNRARYMPQNHFQVATHGPCPEVYVFDLSKHPSFPPSDGVFNPQITCQGHSKEGYALSWSPLKEGFLASGSEDTTVCVWDVNTANNGVCQATSIFKGHTDVVEDVDWHHKDSNMLCSVGDDGSLRLWDLRDPSKPIHLVEKAHDSDVNCVSFNPKNEFILATGSADKTIGIWDIRNLKQRTHTLAGHTDQVYMVDWSPFNESILGSASADRRVGIWDLSRIGMEQSPEDAEDGPPELLFLHGGHTSKVSDFSWNAQDPWTIASVSEDNVLQVWQMAEEIYAGEDDEEDEGDGAGEDKLLGDDELE
mmetsp:Transcript_86198/g.248907  ORF Transcript_86198/g.248907 Transcript_86198/m.248907 type:complete len:467 (+) Transcript_86198:127-1527(+)